MPHSSQSTRPSSACGTGGTTLKARIWRAGGALGPQLDDPGSAHAAESWKRGVVVRAVQDDFVPPGRQRGPAVGYAPHVIVIRSFQPARAERAAVGWQVRPVLPPRGDGCAPAGQRVDPELRLAHRAHARAGYAAWPVLTSMLPLYATPLTRTTGASGSIPADSASPAAETPVPPSSILTPGGSTISVRDL